MNMISHYLDSVGLNCEVQEENNVSLLVEVVEAPSALLFIDWSKQAFYA